MFGKIISVIGGGASSVSLISAILDRFNHNQGLGLTIFLIEKRASFGRGLAYAGDHDSNLLNTRAGYITPFSDKPGHFYSWLHAKREIWEDDFPSVSIDPEAFVPRALFGLYLERMVSDLIHRAIEKGCRLIPIHAEATDVSYGHDGRLVITTDTSLAFQSDHVVLSCGNLGTTEYAAFEDSGDFFASPYPVRRLGRRIRRDAAVGVLGSRLSAIDAVLGLAASDHAGRVTIHSRSGALPCVRGVQGRHRPQVLTPDAIDAHIARFGRITLDEAVRWVRQEMEAAGVPAQNFDPASLCGQGNAIDFLRSEIEAAARPRLWQSVLYATNNVVDVLWNAMPTEDRARFWPYVSWWMTYRVSIPIENARRLLALATSGRLDVVGGNTCLTREDGKLVVDVRRREAVTRHRYDAVVAATGTPRDARRLDSRLIQSLLGKRLAACHAFGGLVISPESGCLVDAAGQEEPRITVLGELTSGTFFFTSVLEINARHAERRASDIVGKLSVAKSTLNDEPRRRVSA